MQIPAIVQPAAAYVESGSLATQVTQAQPAATSPTLPDDAWVPLALELSCADAKACPPQVGLLAFIDSVTPGARPRANLENCTATLVDTDTILTAGHCDQLPRHGFFVIGSGPTRQVRWIKERVFKDYDPQSAKDRSKLAPDMMLLRLDRPITDVIPLPMASGPQRLYDELTAYVVNDLGNSSYRIDAFTCAIGRFAEFPFDIFQSPTLIYARGCPATKGNSGAALLAKGSIEIQAVLQATSEKTPSLALLTNLRCVPRPGNSASNCTTVDNASIQAQPNFTF